MEEALTELKISLARHDERLDDLDEWRKKQNGTLQKIQEELQQLRQDFGQRPTWSVTVLIGLLSTACGSMAVYIITHL